MLDAGTAHDDKVEFGEYQAPSCELSSGICKVTDSFESVVIGAYCETDNSEERAEEKY